MAGKTSKKSARAAKKAAAGPVAAQAKSRTKAPKSESSTPAKPALLAGGNPQIAKAYGDALVQANIAAMPGLKRDVGRRPDAVIVRTVPSVRKAVKWNSPLYGVEDGVWFPSFHVFTKYVKVVSSAARRSVGSRQKDVRYVHIDEDNQLDEAQLAAWVKQASQLPGERL